MASRRATILLATVCLIVGLGLAGCIFQTRQPETGGGAVCFESFPSTEVVSVFANLDGSLDCLQPASYLVQIADDFVFVPSAATQSQFPGVFPDETAWGRNQEESFLDRLFADADSVESHLLIKELAPRQGDNPTTVEGSYRVRVVSGGSAITYSGEAFYTLRTEATNWKMTRWEEQASDSPIGLLRGSLAQ
jgi:hypothetical protein